MNNFSRNSKKELEIDAVSNEEKLNQFSILLIKIAGFFWYIVRYGYTNCFLVLGDKNVI